MWCTYLTRSKGAMACQKVMAEFARSIGWYCTAAIRFPSAKAPVGIVSDVAGEVDISVHVACVHVGGPCARTVRACRKVLVVDIRSMGGLPARGVGDRHDVAEAAAS